MTTSVSGALLDIGFQGNRDLLHMQMDYHDGPFQAMHRFSRVWSTNPGLFLLGVVVCVRKSLRAQTVHTLIKCSNSILFHDLTTPTTDQFS